MRSSLVRKQVGSASDVPVLGVAACVGILALVGCASGGRRPADLRPAPTPSAGPIVFEAGNGPDLPPVPDLLGEPVDVSAVEEPALDVLTGRASYYAESLAGNLTASGEPYEPDSLVAAHRDLPFGTRIRVTNLRNGRSVQLRVIDRGPFVDGRVLDVSRRAAELLGFVKRGLTRVRIEVLRYGPG